MPVGSLNSPLLGVSRSLAEAEVGFCFPARVLPLPGACSRGKGGVGGLDMGAGKRQHSPSQVR